MKIGIDLRFIGENIYSHCITQLIEKLIFHKQEDIFRLYVTKDNSLSIHKKFEHLKNIHIQKIDIPRGSIIEQTKYKKQLKNDGNHLMLFFDQFKPISYKQDYITFIGSLKDFYYSNFSSSIEKYTFFYLAEKNFKKSKKIICLDTKTKDELIERFNIQPNNIEVISGFFPKVNTFEHDDNITHAQVNLANKYAIKNPFFLYGGGNSIEKNYEKLVAVFYKLKKKGKKLDLVFLGDNIANNVNLRNLILEKNMQENIFFLGELPFEQKKYLYAETLGILFPSFYEPFPLKLSEPVYFNTPIIASKLKQIEKIFGNTISYFSPISENSILENIEDYLTKKTYQQKPNYEKIIQKYSLDQSYTQFEEIFNTQ